MEGANETFRKMFWWCSLAFTPIMSGSMIYPVLFLDKSLGNWKNLVELELSSGEVESFDFYAPFDGGTGTTWFLFRTNGDWIRRCIERFGLKNNGYTGDEELMRRMGVFDKGEESSEVSRWTRMDGATFLWKEVLRPSRKEAILGGTEYLPKEMRRWCLRILPRRGGWMTMVERSIPKLLFGGFILVVFGVRGPAEKRASCLSEISAAPLVK